MANNYTNLPLSLDAGITALTGGVSAAGSGSVVATVVTNANLSGVVTSVGNATAIANGAITNAMLANAAVANLSGTNTGNQTITLTGDVTGSGTGSFAATVVQAPAGTLTGTTLSANVVTSSLTALGTIITGVWNGTLIAIAKGGTGVTSVTTVPVATAWAGWDANSNISSNNSIIANQFISANTTLTVASPYLTFVSANSITVTLPVTSTLVVGQCFGVYNDGAGTITVNSSGGNAIGGTIGTKGATKYMCVAVTGTSATSWKSLASVI